jgi:hypothetical protein
MRRIAAYFIVWGCVIAAAVIWRFTYLRGTSSDHRFRLAELFMIATAVIFMSATLYESRRLALLIGFRGRGVVGYLRGWLKTVAIEIAASDDEVPPQALREWLSFRRWSGYALASLIVWITLLVF